MEIVNEEINKKIVILFLEKLEKLTEEERKEIIIAIKWINHPLFGVKN